jgi:hypothetical protein
VGTLCTSGAGSSAGSDGADAPEDFDGARHQEVTLHECSRCGVGYPLASTIGYTDDKFELIKCEDHALAKAKDGWKNLGEKGVKYTATCVHCYVKAHPDKANVFLKEGNKVTSAWMNAARKSKATRVLAKGRAAHIIKRFEEQAKSDGVERDLMGCYKEMLKEPNIVKGADWVTDLCSTVSLHYGCHACKAPGPAD